MNIELRDWQKEAATKCLKWYTQNKDNKFVINAAPVQVKQFARYPLLMN